MNVFAIATLILIVGMVPSLILAVRRPPLDGLVGLQLAGALTTMALVTFALAVGRSSYAGIALISGVLQWISSLVFARLMHGTPQQ